jgi:PAS domain S-box-containing protein
MEMRGGKSVHKLRASKTATVAVIEDDVDLVRLLPKMIDTLGYQVAGVASNGEDALELIAEARPSLVLMDIHLAGGADGIDVAKTIRARHQVPVVFLTGFGDHETLERAKDAAPFGFILKPVALRDLEIGIEIALNRFQLENQVVESERWLSATLACINDGVVTTDETGAVKLVNTAFESMLGCTCKEVLGKQVTEVLADAGGGGDYTGLDLGKAATDEQPIEVELRRSDRVVFPVEISVAPIIGAEDVAIGQVMVLRDLTERRLAAQASALKDYRDLIENAHDAVLILASDGTVLEVNQRMRELYLFSPHEIAGLNLEDLAMHRSEVRQLLQETLAKGSCRGVEMVHFRNDASEMVVEVNASLVRYRERQAILAINRDITERNRSEQALKQSEEQLRRLAEHLESAREQERVSVARAIHDELGQQLTALKLDLSWTRKRLPESDGKLVDKTGAMVKLIDQAIETVQRVCLGLRPSLLDTLGLAAAIEWLVEDLAERSSIEINLEIEPAEPELDERLTVTLFRILQESLNNVIRHASASQVTVSLLCSDGEVELRVRDDGVGISAEQVEAADSIGIIGMQERVRALGGEIKIQGYPDIGTSVMVCIPIPRGERDDHSADR